MKNKSNIIVVGAGIGGLSFAWKAAQAGHRVMVLESQDRVGGCLFSKRIEGFWFEMGAHTTYNSYGGFLDLAEGAGVHAKMVQRGVARAHFGLLFDGRVDWLTPPKVLLRLKWLEAAVRFPVQFLKGKSGLSVSTYYSRLLGPRNYRQVLKPFFTAVPSQPADDFPVTGPGSLFKKRDRRKQYPRSYGFDGGLQTVCDGIADMENITVLTNICVDGFEKSAGGYTLKSTDGRQWQASVVALALPSLDAAGILRHSFGELASIVAEIQTVEVQSLGVVLHKESCSWPPCAFVVAQDDLFYSVVTRDPFPDPTRRAFTFHFKAGLQPAEMRRRMAEVLGVPDTDLGTLYENRVRLPSPRLGHDKLIQSIDAGLRSERLALCGNYFAGLAIEDCVQRSFAEWDRISELAPA